jgi:hypothetical protein
MERSLRLYTAENGELKHEFRITSSIERVERPETEINDDIKRDRESRLLLQYDPDGTVRYYFYARDSGRPEQYIAEYGVSQKASREKVLEGFKNDLNVALRKVGYEVDGSSWESRALDKLDGLEQIERPDISEDGRRALRKKGDFELAVPDMDAALWLFNRVSSNKSVVISEGGYLGHRGQDDVLIQVDSMRREVEPIESTKEEVDDTVVKDKKQEFRDAYRTLKQKAGSRKSTANSISDALRDAGVTESLGVEVYSKDRSSEIRRRFGVLSFLVVTLLSALAGVVLVRERLAEAITRTVELGQPVYGSGVEIQSWWVLGVLGVVVLLSGVARISSVQDGFRSLFEAVTPGSTAPGRGMGGDAKEVVDALSEIQKRESSKATRLLEKAVPQGVAVDEGSRDTFRRKNAAIGAGIGALSGAVLVGISGAILLFAFSSWRVFIQLLIVLLAVGVVLTVVGAALSVVRGSSSPHSHDSGPEPSSDTGSGDEVSREGGDDYTPAAMNRDTKEPTTDIEEAKSFPWKITILIVVLLLVIAVLVYFGVIRG